MLPFWHSGMEQVKPYGVGALYPFNHVHVTVGEPVDFSDLVGRCRKCSDDKQREELFVTMVARVEESMRSGGRGAGERKGRGGKWIGRV